MTTDTPSPTLPAELIEEVARAIWIAQGLALDSGTVSWEPPLGEQWAKLEPSFRSKAYNIATAAISTPSLTAMREALIDVTAHLVAAHSLLSKSPKTAAPSNKMFDQMLRDYAKSIERGRAALSHSKKEDGQ